ncbi:MAG: M42 family peptidase [Clostridia bacterium]|nr:M42 family peptidase [Clostridia bacterium]
MDLRTLCDLQGISGREEPVRRAVYAACVEKLGQERVYLDRMGNVIAEKDGQTPSAPHTMVCAHMDEVGLMVISATEDGLLRVRAIGSMDPRVLVSKRVRVGYEEKEKEKKALNGVIGALAIHQQSLQDRKTVLPIDQLYVDIGAKDKEEAVALAPAGTPVTFATSFAGFGEGLYLAKALDDRVGVYNLLRLLDAECRGRTSFVFTCQEEVGCRGAAGAAFRLQPDAGLVLEGTSANDRGDVPAAEQVCRVGEGVAISFIDNSSLAHPRMFAGMLSLAKEKGIAHQVKQSVSGGNEGGTLQRTGMGVKTCVLSVPCRYIHSPNAVCAAGDVEAQRELAKAFLEQGIDGIE